MKFAKLLLVLFTTFVAVIALTGVWFISIRSKIGPGTIDIVVILTRPLYLLELFVIVALAAWVGWRWVFA